MGGCGLKTPAAIIPIQDRTIIAQQEDCPMLVETSPMNRYEAMAGGPPTQRPL